ncbi:MAG: hypothetical protein HFH03_11960 [Dorea sp.]|nr:hypothetical protein [Dorea sp.]
MKKYVFLSIIILLITACGKTGRGGGTESIKHVDQAVETRQLEIVASRYDEIVWNQGYRYFEMDISEAPIESKNGYYLGSVDYSESKSSYWPAIRHLEYTMAYIRNIGQEKLAQKPGEREIILGLIDFWICNDFQNEKNWYYNQIGVPYDLADIAIMMGEWLDEGQKEKISEILDRGTVGRGVRKLVAESNGTDFLNISIMNAIITGSSELMKECALCIGELIIINDDKDTGIQTDLSYFDYTALCSGGAYAATYIDNISWLLYLVHDTDFYFDKEKEKIFIDFLLDGQRFFHRIDGVPQFSMARSTYQASGGRYVKKALERLVSIDGIYRHDELEKYLLSFDDTSLIEGGIKYFPISGTMVSNGKDGYIAVRGSKADISMTDVQIEEGVLNYNYSYGSNTCYMQDGNEYSAIGAVFDYSMVPGTTAYHESDEELLKRWEEDYNQTWGHVEFIKTENNDCIGYVGNNIGVLVTDIRHDSIDGRNIFILRDNTLYCLGLISIDSKKQTQSNNSIRTTVDQSLSDGKALTNNVLKNGAYCKNGGFVYRNLCDSILHVDKRKQNGTISRISLNNPDSDNIQTEEVFACYYDWGTSSGNMAYAYSVSALNEDENIVNIVNNEDCQIVEFSDGMIAGYCYKKTQVQEDNHEYDVNEGVVLHRLK